MKRRALFKATAGSAIAAATMHTHAQSAAVDTLGYRGAYPFQHGVASGDPWPTQVILWTRITAPGLAVDSIPVGVRVARDPAMSQLVLQTTGYAHALNDFTFKIDALLPQPDTAYYYQFEALGHRSDIGRTRTAPAADAALPQARFAVVSCSNYGFGYFNAYRNIAARADLDAVLHLGDYIYEHAQGFYADPALARQRPIDPPHELVTLSDYRRRYACYRLDPDLRECHRQHPFICVWDDHEITNDANKDGAISHPAWLGDYTTRKLAAVRAYHEWMPIRAVQPDNLLRIYRTLRYGKLLSLQMLDTRLIGRDQQDLTRRWDGRRQILGAAQESWLYAQWTESRQQGVQWSLMGQQVMFSPLLGMGPYSEADSWNGYSVQRDRLLDFIQNQRIDNVVVLTGDYHSSFAFDVCKQPHLVWVYDPRSGAGSVAVEFLTPAITSPGSNNTALKGLNPHLKFYDGTQRGYVVLDVTPQRCQGDFFFVHTITSRDTTERHAASLFTASGANHLTVASTPSAPNPRAYALAPVPVLDDTLVGWR
ncbi:MAG: alkaline phosphatase D family protein [Pseudomonadota bacterium]|nr:alkaline phosphatase D family protein [Pseudomonadota bacterium]